MSENGTMKIAAEIVDKFSKPLRALREDLGKVKPARGQSDIQRNFYGMRDAIAAVRKELGTGLSPMLASLNFRTLTVGGALAAVTMSLRGLGTNLYTLAMLSKETGISIDRMRQLDAAGERLGVTADRMNGSFGTFARNMKELRAGMGGTLSTLFANGDEHVRAFAQSLRGVGSNEEALNRILKFLDRITNPIDKQRFLEAFGLPAELGRATSQELEEYARRVGGTTASLQRDAKTLNNAWFDLKESWDNLVLELAKDGAFSAATASLKALGSAAHAIRDDLTKLWRHDWEGLSKDDPEHAARLLKRQLAAKERALAGLDEGIEQNKRSGAAGIGYAELERKKLIEEIEKLRKAIEENNSDRGLQKQSFIGGGFNRNAVIPAAFYSGGADGGGRPGGARQALRAATAPMGDVDPLSDPGAGLKGSDYLRAQRADLKAQIDKDAGLREQLAGMLATEGTPVPTMEALANRTEMLNAERRKRGLPPLSLRQMLHSGFYGPINRGQLPGAIAALRHDPKRMARMNAAINAVLNGSNVIKGATDQGMPSDPNGRWVGPDNFRLGPDGRPFRGRGGNIFNDWGGGYGHEAARRFRLAQQQHVRDGADAARSRMFTAARDSALTGFPVKVGGNASVQIDLNGFPRGTTTKTSASGIFDKIELNRGKTMPVASEAD